MKNKIIFGFLALLPVTLFFIVLLNPSYNDIHCGQWFCGLTVIVRAFLIGTAFSLVVTIMGIRRIMHAIREKGKILEVVFYIIFTLIAAAPLVLLFVLFLSLSAAR